MRTCWRRIGLASESSTFGLHHHAVVRHGVLEDGIAFLSKPFDLRELGRTVREVLDSGRFASETVPGS